MYRVSNFITIFGVCLMGGTLVALVWANLWPQSYQDMVELRLIDGFPVGYPNPDAVGPGGRTLTLLALINTVLMAFFFLLTGKEVWEAAIQDHGVLRGPQAVVPLAAAAGGMAVPVLVHVGLVWVTGRAEAAGGWAVPAATDVALAYLVGRAVFGPGHPALRTLLLVAICTDLAAVLVLGLLFPSAPLEPAWLVLSALAAGLVFALCNWLPRRLDRGDQLRGWSTWMRKRLSIWPYAAAGVASWYGFQEAGLHPALGLLPIIPAIPHADRAFGFFAEAEEYLTDLLNRVAHLLTWPVALSLALFGLVNGGALLAVPAGASWIIAVAMVVGKPLGVIAGAMLAMRLTGLPLPLGMRPADLALIGLIAAPGLTVPLLMTAATLPGGFEQEAARLGVILSLLAAPVAVLAAWRFGVGRWAAARR